jgi:hypothetical protein
MVGCWYVQQGQGRGEEQEQEGVHEGQCGKQQLRTDGSAAKEAAVRRDGSPEDIQEQNKGGQRAGPGYTISITMAVCDDRGFVRPHALVDSCCAAANHNAQKEKWWSRKESDAHKDVVNSSDEELYLASTKPDDMADLTAGPVDQSVWHETKQRCGDKGAVCRTVPQLQL